jgi:heparanase 1
MRSKTAAAVLIGAALLALSGVHAEHTQPATSELALDPAQLRVIGEVDERFQSYNVETVEVTGGNFWAPYQTSGTTPHAPVAGPHGTEFATSAYQKRDPIDLKNRRLRALTRALGPAYMRVSGSWANSTYFQDDDELARAPPAGSQGVLTRAQWAGVVDFATAVDARILTSFTTSEGARGADGAWDPEQAKRLFSYTHSLGGRIDAVELMNEPNVSRKPYAPEVYARDHVTLRSLVTSVSPQTLIVGPSSTGEAGFKLFANPPEAMSTVRLLSGSPLPRFDIFSHHFYGAVSQRCKSLGERRRTEVTTSAAEALSEGWLARADQAQTFYKRLRDRFAPGAPIWITETAQTACGGDPWASTFLDTFRYVDQLGRLAKQDVSIVFHNTLAASDYALIDDVIWQPRPNYWAALLWRRLMGQVVLDAGSGHGDLHVYAHCLRGHPGGVALVAINLSLSKQARLKVSSKTLHYWLTAETLESSGVKLNDRSLTLTRNDELPEIVGKPARKGVISFAPTSITFVEIPRARNAACRSNRL